jgi:hypothetical protein
MVSIIVHFQKRPVRRCVQQARLSIQEIYRQEQEDEREARRLALLAIEEDIIELVGDANAPPPPPGPISKQKAQEYLLWNDTGADLGEECAVCYKAIRPGDPYVSLNCQPQKPHLFCYICFERWTTQSYGMCPLCRTPV